MNITGTTPEEEYRIRNPDGHWFDSDTLRFFRSRIDQHAYGPGLKKLYFVSSEKNTGFCDHPRLYTVRVIDEKGDISDIGGFQAYKSLSGATSAMRRAAKADQEGDAE